MIKSEIKKRYQSKRKTLSPKELNTISENICQNLFQQFNLENKLVSLFLPIEKENEINTYLILNKALSINCMVALPKLNEEKSSLLHYLYHEKNELEISFFGIPEPKGGKLIAADRIEVFIVPLFICDKKGNRVGYGKGFYDRLLAKSNTNALFIGICHFDEFQEIDDLHLGDVKLHFLVTPNSVHRFPLNEQNR